MENFRIVKCRDKGFFRIKNNKGRFLVINGGLSSKFTIEELKALLPRIGDYGPTELYDIVLGFVKSQGVLNG